MATIFDTRRSDRRLDKDRRSGIDTRPDEEKARLGERRSGLDRRSGVDRRKGNNSRPEISGE